MRAHGTRQRSPLPQPMLARPGPLPHGDYAYEVKWDGFRAIVSTEDSLEVRSRSGWSMAERLAELARLPTGLVLDGELVAFDGDGRASFPPLGLRARPCSASDRRSSSSARARSSWARRPATSPGRKYSAASPRFSRCGGRSLSTTAVPHAAASTAGSPKPSATDGTTAATAPV